MTPARLGLSHFAPLALVDMPAPIKKAMPLIEINDIAVSLFSEPGAERAGAFT